jgi:hypothetical protein
MFRVYTDDDAPVANELVAHWATCDIRSHNVRALWREALSYYSECDPGVLEKAFPEAVTRLRQLEEEVEAECKQRGGR